jgi:DNA-binding transcriptional regulator of glucitol operon
MDATSIAQHTSDPEHMAESQRYVSGSEDEDEITLLDMMQARISHFNQFMDLQYLTHPIHHHQMQHLIQLSVEHSLSMENAVKRVIHVV